MTKTVKCDFCDATAKGTQANLIEQGWLFFDITHTDGINVVKYHGASCKKHTERLMARFNLLMEKNTLKASKNVKKVAGESR